MRELETTRAPIDGAGERAALVTEDLALQQRFRNRRTVDGHKQMRAASAQLVDRLGDKLLPGARFAVHEHRRGGWRSLLDQTVHRSYGWRVADHLPEVTVFLQLTSETRDLPERSAPLGDMPQQRAEALRIDGLREVIERAVLHRRHGGLDAALGGNEDKTEV